MFVNIYFDAIYITNDELVLFYVTSASNSNLCSRKTPRSHISAVANTFS